MNLAKIHETMDTDAAWDYLTETGLTDEDALRLVTSINGYSYDTLCSVLFVLTGDRYFGQNEDDD